MDIDSAKSGFLVLGGNQHAGKRYSSVNTTFFSRKQTGLVFDSVRSISSIPKLPS